MAQVSSPFAAEIVESADAYVVVGPTFNVRNPSANRLQNKTAAHPQM